MRRLVVVSALVLTLIPTLGLLAPREAAAQFNLYAFPVEKGTVESMVDLQLYYSHLGLDLGSRSVDADMVTLSIEGQYAFAGFFEVGLNIPLLQHASATSSGWMSSSTEETRFGNIELGLKAKVFSVGSFLSLAAFLDTYLPTHSGDTSHDLAVLVPGAALSGAALGFIYGAALKFPWYINGAGDDVAMIGLDVYFGYQLLGLLSFQLAFQYTNSIHPGTEASPFAIVPGIDVTLIKLIRLGLASRIAINDDAELFYGGRISLLFHGGVAFSGARCSKARAGLTAGGSVTGGAVAGPRLDLIARAVDDAVGPVLADGGPGRRVVAQVLAGIQRDDPQHAALGELVAGVGAGGAAPDTEEHQQHEGRQHEQDSHHDSPFGVENRS